MKERIKLIRKDFDLTQTEFAERLGLSRNHIAQVETEKGTFSDRTIKDICREFKVNEEWLRTGKGEMYDLPMDDVASVVYELLEESNPLFDLMIELIRGYSKLDSKSKRVIDSLIDAAVEEAHNKKDEG